MKYNQIDEVIFQINQVINKEETKVQKKLVKFAEKLKTYQEEYRDKIQELRLDNAATDKDDVLLTNEKGEFKFTKDGIKKLNAQIKELGEKEFNFKPIEVINTSGLEVFTFLKDWTTGITFIEKEEEEL